MKTSWTTVARVLLAGHILFLAWVLFNPAPDVAIGTVGGVAERLASLGLPDRLVSSYRVEFVLNALMFAPLPFLGALAFPQMRWSDWVAWTFIGSASAEVIQGLFLSGRSAQFVDVVANTLGGVLGAVCALVVAAVLRPRAMSEFGTRNV